jgi:hypothetical protein
MFSSGEAKGEDGNDRETDSTTTVMAVSGPPGVIENEEDNEMNLVNIFREISGLDPTTAKHYLQVSKHKQTSLVVFLILFSVRQLVGMLVLLFLSSRWALRPHNR